MTDKLIMAAPRWDEATEYSFAWAKWTMEKIEEYVEQTKCYDALAVKESVIAEVRKMPKAKWFVHYDHGSEYVLWGDDAQPIINLDNLGELAGMHVYNMNCLSGKGLGAHALDSGLLEFLGYMESYAFTTDTLTENRDATSYGLIEALRRGLHLKDIVEEMRQHGYEIANALRVDGKWLAAASLVRNMNSLVCYYPGAPPPPPPECPVSRALVRLLGWRSLGFLRRIRQKMFPEKKYAS